MMQFRSCLYCNRAMTLTNNEIICNSCRILVNRSVGLTDQDRSFEPELDIQADHDQPTSASSHFWHRFPNASRRREASTPFRARNPEAFAYEYYNLTGEEPDSTFAGEHLPPLTLASEAFQLTEEQIREYHGRIDQFTRRFRSISESMSLNGLTRKLQVTIRQKLKTRTLTESDLEECNMECAICTEKFEYLELTLLPCNHEYHSGCIDQWLRLNASCPICRFSLLSTTTQGRVQAREPESPTLSSPEMTSDVFMIYHHHQDYSVTEYMDDVD